VDAVCERDRDEPWFAHNNGGLLAGNLLGVTTTVGCVTKPGLAPTRVVAARLDPQYPLDALKYYPIPSRDLGEEGTCLIGVWVHPDGAVHATQIRKTSGFATLDDACVAMMADARFLPARNARGERIASWVTVPIVWQLDQSVPPAIMRGYVLEVGDDYYPEAARQLHQEGDCIVGVFVYANGIGSYPYIYQSTGSAALDAACIKAVSKAAFTPALRNGVPTGAALRIPISWRLGKY